MSCFPRAYFSRFVFFFGKTVVDTEPGHFVCFGIAIAENDIPLLIDVAMTIDKVG
jgi:hypothetical protein